MLSWHAGARASVVERGSHQLRPGELMRPVQIEGRARPAALASPGRSSARVLTELPRESPERRRQAYHRVQPARSPLGVQTRGVAHEDLEAALVGVVGVVGAHRVAPRDAQQRVRVRAEQLEDERLSALAIHVSRPLGRIDLRRFGAAGRHAVVFSAYRDGFVPRPIPNHANCADFRVRPRACLLHVLDRCHVYGEKGTEGRPRRAGARHPRQDDRSGRTSAVVSASARRLRGRSDDPIPLSSTWVVARIAARAT